METNKILYTVGHSNQTLESFVEEIKSFGIDCIVDVRSVPASKYVPQFNRDSLQEYLVKEGISYGHFGYEFGARRNDALDINNNVDFVKTTKTEAFLQGVERIIQGLNSGYKIALMCTESNPLECHRFAMVSRFFHESGIPVCHILAKGSCKSHEALESAMVAEYVAKRKLPDVDLLFGEYNEEQQLQDAYKLKNKELAFHVEEFYD